MASIVSPASLAADGYATVADAADELTLQRLAEAVEPLLSGLTRTQGGVRDALKLPAVRAAAAGPLRVLATAVLGDDCVAVSATLFDKTPGRNWKVPFHQDVTIKVRSRERVPGFETWWEKAGVTHCWATRAILETMLAVRLHLDDCGPDNGPLRVLPGSHLAGVLDAAGIDAWPRDKEVACPAARGGVILMRPLLLHASSAAASPDRRRILHVEFASPKLPGDLRWHEAIAEEP